MFEIAIFSKHQKGLKSCYMLGALWACSIFVAYFKSHIVRAKKSKFQLFLFNSFLKMKSKEEKDHQTQSELKKKI